MDVRLDCGGTPSNFNLPSSYVRGLVMCVGGLLFLYENWQPDLAVQARFAGKICISLQQFFKTLLTMVV